MEKGEKPFFFHISVTGYGFSAGYIKSVRIRVIRVPLIG